MIGNQLEVDEQIIRQSFQEKFKYRQAGGDFQIESTVDKTEMPRAAVVQHLEFAEKTLNFEGPRGFIQRRQAELAFERAAARGFDINEAPRDVFVAVFAIGQRDVSERRLFAGVDFLCRRLACHNVGA